MKISCGEGTLILSGKHAFALKEWHCRGQVICCQEGFNGTVIANAPGKFIGVGHNEGGTEKFHDFSLSVDGTEKTEFAGESTGRYAEYRRKTSLEHLQTQIDCRFTGDEMFNACTCLAAEDQQIALFYCHQYSWSTSFDRFIYLDENNVYHEGSCVSGGEMNYWGKFRYGALFSPEYQAAVFFALDPGTAEISTGKLWDRHIYHKFYCELDFKGSLPAGRQIRRNGFFARVFNTGENSWRSDTENLAAQLPVIWQKYGFQPL